MANHVVTASRTKDRSVFASVTEALEQHLNDSSQSATTEAEYQALVDGQTDYTETRELTSNGSAVASGTVGNGYNIIRTWTTAKITADIDAKTDSSSYYYDSSPYTVSGWTIEANDKNSSGVPYAPNWHSG